MRFWSGLGAVVGCLVLGSFASAVTITQDGTSIDMDFVTIGDAGNDPDDATGYGAVDYTYQIGTYEVTAAQYTAFLNAVASTDTYNLYNTNMASNFYGCKIQRSGSSGSYSYSVSDEYANRPVNYVSWYDAARFTNWLTSGDTESGVYLFDQGVFQGKADNAKSQGATYWIPTEDEWYKAAYWNGDTFQEYATKAGESLAQGDGSSGTGWNYDVSGVGHAMNPPGTWDVGSGSIELNDTYDMMGDVSEWVEDPYRDDSVTRVLRGGAYFNHSDYLASTKRGAADPPDSGWSIGFRVASNSVAAVPEPGSLIIWACGGLGAVVLRRRRR